MDKRKLLFFELPYLLVALFAAFPLWVGERVPLQDMPQHLAAVRIFIDHGDASLGFARYFDIELFRTQYLAYYLVVALFAKVLGVMLANKLVLSAALVGTPYAMRYLLHVQHRDERASLFVLPLTWNAHLLLGFFNFIAAIPLCLVGLALAIELRDRFENKRAALLGFVALTCFYTHVVPFAFLGLGAFILAFGDDAKRTLMRLAPLVPSGVAMLVWSQASPAGQATVLASGAGAVSGLRPSFVPVPDLLRVAPNWLTDILQGPKDDQLLAAWAVLVLLTFGVGTALASEYTGDPVVRRARAVIGVLAPIALVGYFLLPEGYDWIWPINFRFPLLALIFLVAVLPFPDGRMGHTVAALVTLISLMSFTEVARAFEAYCTEEVGELDEAISTIPQGKRVAGLIFDRGSNEVKFSPFIHSVAYYQLERGGAVMFSFADFAQSPVRFREDNRPPRVGPRWEWMPDNVNPERDLDYYDYVLTRGGPGRIEQMPSLWQRVFSGPKWRVFKRRPRPAVPEPAPSPVAP